jgi:hypothetical protein
MEYLDEKDKEFILLALTTALKHKREMIEAGERQRIAVCPRCEGSLRLLLAGPKNHVRMFCQACQLQMME